MEKTAIQIFVNKDFHKVFKAAAAKEGKTMKAVILGLLDDYAHSQIDPVTHPMPYDDVIQHPKP